MKKLLILTGGGDCPGLNAVIRAVVRSAAGTGNWQVFGSREAWRGVMADQIKLIDLNDHAATAGIHVLGGTILGTSSKADPFVWASTAADGTTRLEDRSAELLQRIRELGIDGIISIGGDGSQRIGQKLYEMGMPIVGVPKTIDNDLSATQYTFGFQTAVQEACDAVDKLVTTAASHHRVMILETMGRDAGWIALHAAVAGGAEICLIPEIPYDIHCVLQAVEQRYQDGRGFAIIVIAEGARARDGQVTERASDEAGYQNPILGGVGAVLASELKDAGCKAGIRVTVLGHLQRGGSPIAFDRNLATQFGVKAFDLVEAGAFGQMVAWQNGKAVAVSLEAATSAQHLVTLEDPLVQAARRVGISFGD